MTRARFERSLLKFHTRFFAYAHNFPSIFLTQVGFEPGTFGLKRSAVTRIRLCGKSRLYGCMTSLTVEDGVWFDDAAGRVGENGRVVTAWAAALEEFQFAGGRVGRIGSMTGVTRFVCNGKTTIMVSGSFQQPARLMRLYFVSHERASFDAATFVHYIGTQCASRSENIVSCQFGALNPTRYIRNPIYTRELLLFCIMWTENFIPIYSNIRYIRVVQ